MRSRDHFSCGITQCYVPPGRGDSHDFTPWHSPVGLLILTSHARRVEGTAGNVLQPVPKREVQSWKRRQSIPKTYIDRSATYMRLHSMLVEFVKSFVGRFTEFVGQKIDISVNFVTFMP